VFALPLNLIKGGADVEMNRVAPTEPGRET
jgi:hypothetical protein